MSQSVVIKCKYCDSEKLEAVIKEDVWNVENSFYFKICVKCKKAEQIGEKEYTSIYWGFDLR